MTKKTIKIIIIIDIFILLVASTNSYGLIIDKTQNDFNNQIKPFYLSDEYSDSPSQITYKNLFRNCY